MEVGTTGGRVPSPGLPTRLSENFGSRLVNDRAGPRRATILRIDAMIEFVLSVLMLILFRVGVLGNNL